MESESTKTQSMIFGEVASSGLARGFAFVCACTDEAIVSRRRIDASEAAQEIARFDAAIATAERALLQLQQEVQRGIGKQEAAIFETQVLLLRDPSFREQVSARVLTEKINVEAAVDAAFEKLVSAFVRLDDSFFRERAADLREVRKRLLDILADKQPTAIPVLPAGGVLVASQLLSSVMAQLDDQTIHGLILE